MSTSATTKQNHRATSLLSKMLFLPHSMTSANYKSSHSLPRQIQWISSQYGRIAFPHSLSPKITTVSTLLGSPYSAIRRWHGKFSVVADVPVKGRHFAFFRALGGKNIPFLVHFI